MPHVLIVTKNLESLIYRMSYVLRSVGFNSSMLLQYQKLRIQNTLGTEDKEYKSDTTRPPLSELIDDIFSRYD